MKKLILVAGLLAASACVYAPTAPYGGGGYGGPAEPDIYDLPAHCYYDQYQQVICR